MKPHKWVEWKFEHNGHPVIATVRACACDECEKGEARHKKLVEAARDAVTAYNRGRDMAGPVHRIELALKTHDEA